MREKLLTKLRGKDYRAAYRAIPQLCKLDDGSACKTRSAARLRVFAGASRRTVMEKLAPDNLPSPHPKHDWPEGLPKPVYRVWDRGSGLLEIKVLESALKQIRARS